MSSELAAAEAEPDSTGAPPPPMARVIQWPLALGVAAVVTFATAVLFVLASVVPLLTPLGLLALLSVSSVVVGIYQRRSAPAPLNGAMGGKLGLATGLLLIAMMGMALAGVGLVARFRLHAMAAFDAQWAGQVQVLAERTAEQAKSQGVDPGSAVRELGKPEFRAGAMLLGTGMVAVVLLGITTGAGALAGTMAESRHVPGGRAAR